MKTPRVMSPKRLQRIRFEYIKAWVTPFEKSRLKAIAKAAAVSMSDLLRLSGLGWPISTPTENDREMTRQLARFGNLLNQIARACNYQMKKNESIDKLELLIELRKLRELMEAYASKTE